MKNVMNMDSDENNVLFVLTLKNDRSKFNFFCFK